MAAKKTRKKKATAKKAAPKKSPARKKGASATQDVVQLQKQELAKLKNVALEAAEVLEKATTVHEASVEAAKEKLRTAKEKYATAIVPYRDACRKAKVTCEFGGGRAGDVSAQVRFDVKKVKGGVDVTVHGKPKTTEKITAATLEASTMKASKAYCDKHIGPVSKVGKKFGSLYNRIRAVLAA